MGRYSRKDMIEFANFAKSYQSSKKVEDAYQAYLKGTRMVTRREVRPLTEGKTKSNVKQYPNGVPAKAGPPPPPRAVKESNMNHGMCEFCRVREAIGVFCSHMPISLGYCQQCLDAKQIRTVHNVNMNWVRTGNEYFEKNNCTVFFNGEYLPIKKYSETVTEEDMREYYKDLTVWTQFVESLINRINERRIR